MTNRLKHTNNAGQTPKNIRIAQATKLAHEFNARFLDNYPEIFAIGDEPLGTWAISDQFWNLEDMALAMESELTPEELCDWYWETVERRSVIKKRRKPTINLKSCIMGARYVEEVK